MIKIENVTKRYGKVVAVDDLSLHVKAGEVFGFLGPNGAGKTTTLKMLAGLLTPTSGAMYIDGHDVVKEPMPVKSVTGYVPDKPYTYDKLTGAELLEFVRDIYNVNGLPESHALQDRLIEMFGLSEWMDELTESYSHGMRQKLIITAALTPGPKAIIIDEPMVGLDAKGMLQVRELFREVASHGAAVLLSTHTMPVAERVCDRIGILNHGKLVAIGTMDELRARAGGGDSDLESVFLNLTEKAENK